MVVEPESGCWLSGRLVLRRDGASWAEELRRYPGLDYLVSDAGNALAKGVQLLRAQRPGLRHGLDLFHTLRAGNVALGRMYRAAARAVRQAEHAQQAADRRGQQGRSRAGWAAVAARGWRRAERLLDRAGAAETAWRECRAAWDWFTPDGAANDRARAEAVRDGALPRLPGAGWEKTKRLLRRPEALTFLDEMHRGLAGLALAEETLASLVLLEGLRRRPERLQGEGPQAAAARGLVLVAGVQLAKTDPGWPAQAERLRAVLRRAWRASSAVEGLNSVARMQQARHRRMTQGLLDLKRFYWNLRRFRTGRRRGRTPYELLALQLPAGTWWQLLQRTPEQLRQQLSAQEHTQ